MSREIIIRLTVEDDFTEEMLGEPLSYIAGIRAAHILPDDIPILITGPEMPRGRHSFPEPV